MKPTLLTLGTNRDYVEIAHDKDSIQKGIDKLRYNIQEGLLEALAENGRSISGLEVKQYGGEEEIEYSPNFSGEMLADSLFNLFEKVEAHGEKHGVPYVSAEGLRIPSGRLSKMQKIYCKAQLLLEEKGRWSWPGAVD